MKESFYSEGCDIISFKKEMDYMWEINKSNRYIQEVYEILNEIEFSKLDTSTARKELQEELYAAFITQYGKDFIEEGDEGTENVVTIPALIKDCKEREYVGLIDISIRESGEHWGTTIFTTEGVKHQEKEDFSHFITYPYKYRPLVEIIGDIHTGAYY